MITLPLAVWALGLVFISGGVYVAIEEALEDSSALEASDKGGGLTSP